MAKDKVNTLDIKSMPRWQKYTIIAFVLVLAATFLISGAMIALVEFWAEGESPNGHIGDEVVSAEHFRTRYHVISEVMRNPDMLERIYPEVAFFDPVHQMTRPDPDHPWGAILGGPVRIPDALNAQLLSEARAPRDRHEATRELLGRLTWMHVLLAHEARLAGVTVPEREAQLVAHEIVLGPIEDDELVALDDDDESFEPPSFAAREARFRERVRTDMDPQLYQDIVRELLVVKRFVENQIDGTVSVSLDEVLDAYRANQQRVEAEYIRVPVFNQRNEATVPFAGPLPATLPGNLARYLEYDAEAGTLTFEGSLDRTLERRMLAVSDDPYWQQAVTQLAEELSPFHPTVERRARQTLARERELAAARRSLAETTGVTTGALFPDPVKAFAQERLNEDRGSDFREPRYQLAILPVRYRDMAEGAPIDPEMIERFYNHMPYREKFLRSDLSDEEVEARITALREGVETLAKDVLDGFDALAKAVAPGWQEIADEEGRERDIDELRADFETPLRDALRYRPLDEVRDEIREYLRYDAGQIRARLLVQQMQQQIESRQRLNEDAFNHARAVADARLRQARLYEELYWGATVEDGSIGLLAGVQGIERTLSQSLRTLRRRAGLYDDPIGEHGVALDGMISMATYRAALAAMAEQVAEQGWAHFVETTRIAHEYSTQDNDPARLQREIDRLQSELDRIGEARELQQVRRREIQQTHVRWTQRRLEELTELRDAYEEAFEVLAERIESELELTYLLGATEAPRLLLEERVALLEESLQRILSRAAEASGVTERADDARRRALSAVTVFEPFRRAEQQPQAGGLPVEGTVDVLRALPPQAFGIEPMILRNEMTFPGLVYDGLPGASVSPMRLQWGLTLDEIEESERLREALPYLRDARVWDFDTGSPGTEPMRTVLRNLAPRTYSQPLGVTGVGYYVLALLEREDPTLPSVAEVEEQALELFLDRDSPDRRVAAAREIAREIRESLERRSSDLQSLDHATLAVQLERAAGRLAGTVGRTPYWSANTPYERAALDELVALLRGDDNVQVATQTQVGMGTAAVQRRRAATEARALLMRDAMHRIAERHGFAVEQTRPFGRDDRLTRLWLNRGTKEFWRAMITLAPHAEFTPPIEETFPARGQRDEDRRSNRRTAFVVARSLGTLQPEGDDELEIAELDVELLEDARTRLRVQRILDASELQRFTDLALMLRHFEEQLGKKVEILSRQPQGGRGR